MKRSRLIVKHGLLDYAEMKGMEKAKGEAIPEKLSLLSKLWKDVI